MDLVARIWGAALPYRCAGCGGEVAEGLCMSCCGRLKPLVSQTCPFCNRLSERGLTCPSCRARTSLTGAVVVMHYEPPLREAIMRAKYSGDPRLAAWLGKRLTTPLFPAVDLLTFVPLHRRRRWWRGYNQSELLCRAVSTEASLPYRPLIKRVVSGRPQSFLSRKERLENVKNAYVSIKNNDLNGKRVLVLDDVLTTGATLDACAAALREAGAKQVWGLVLAKHR